MIDSGELDGLIIAENNLHSNYFVKNIIKICKLYDVSNVGIVNLTNPFNQLYWLDSEKSYIPYLETNLIDSCNLNCKGCTHYSNLFSDEDFYSLEDFKRDVKQIAKNADILRFRLLGGEPLKLKNLDQYIKIARQFLPNTGIDIVTNGLLLPNAPQYLFRALRENKCVVDVSLYPPTVKIIDNIKSILSQNNVPFSMTKPVENFVVFLSLHDGHNPMQSRSVCINDHCRFIRNGKIYKCPVDALSFKLVERFKIKKFPVATSIDIFAKNFPALIEQLNDNIELCTWCNEQPRLIDWTPQNKPLLKDWLAEPKELPN